MGQWTELVGELSEAHLEALFSVGVEQPVPVGTVLVEEGAPGEAMYFLIRGLLEVRVRAIPDAPVARLGPGEIVGDMAFLDHQPASAKVVVAEDAVVLRLPHDQLLAYLGAHPELAAALYRVLGAALSRRLRRALGQIAVPAIPDDHSPAWRRARVAIDAFTSRLIDADKQAIRNKGVVNEALLAELPDAYATLGRTMSAIMDEEAGELAGAEIGRLVQRELLPFLLMTRVAERMYSKPRGYAGDYLTLELMYENAGGGSGRLGPLLDRCFLQDRAARAVRNRRTLVANEIARAVEWRAGQPTAVLALASGPAREVFDALTRVPDPTLLHATLVDADGDALDFVRKEAEQRGLSDRFALVHENPIFLAIGRRKVALPPLDLVYSIGLTDYTNDKVVLRILDYAFDVLRPGGRVIIGNFHPANTSRVLMEHVLEWQLIHRTEAQMNALFMASKFAQPCTRVTFEDEGIDLFAECVKPV